VPAPAAFAIFQFLWVWNDLLVAYVFPGRDAADDGAADRARRAGGRTAGDVAPADGRGVHLSMVLPLDVFFSLQKYFVRGLTAGAVKG
jgi:alpha-glucoside transport system permease protein